MCFLLQENNLNQCPLCLSAKLDLFFESNRKNLLRDYLKCEICDLVFVPPEFHLNEEDEKKRYLEHENLPYDPNYRKFLNRLKMQIDPLIKSDSVGLDFGSGPELSLLHI